MSQQSRGGAGSEPANAGNRNGGFFGQAGDAGFDGGVVFGSGGSGGGAGARGGDGGSNSGSGGIAGTSGSLLIPLPSAPSTIAGVAGAGGKGGNGGGISGGGGGGGGGNGILTSGGDGTAATIAADATGGTGGRGGDGTDGRGGHGGGGGSAGYGFAATTVFDLTYGGGATIVLSGGTGGAGGGSANGAGSANGGDGGGGAYFSAADSSLTVLSGAVVRGGTGGASGDGGGGGTFGFGGRGGVGGNGVEMLLGGTITNYFAIAGGDGGAGEQGGGNGGSGIFGQNLTIINTGLIAGGVGGAQTGGGTNAGAAGDAISLTGGANRLVLSSNSANGGIVGDISIGGSLTIDTSTVFETTLGYSIKDTVYFTGYSFPGRYTTTTVQGSLVKDGVGALVLSGANTYSLGTTIAAGTLVLDRATTLDGNGNIASAAAGKGAISFDSSAGGYVTLALTAAADPGNGGTFANTLNNFTTGSLLELRPLTYAAGATVTVATGIGSSRAAAPLALAPTPTLTVTSGGISESFTLSGDVDDIYVAARRNGTTETLVGTGTVTGQVSVTDGPAYDDNNNQGAALIDYGSGVNSAYIVTSSVVNGSQLVSVNNGTVTQVLDLGPGQHGLRLNFSDNIAAVKLQGGWGADVLRGGRGNDVLDGGLGIDTMAGGLGNDLYSVINPGSIITEEFGSGLDTVYTRASYTLGDNLENIVAYAAGLTVTGNSEANGLFDYVASGSTMAGGAGNDFYYVRNSNSTISEAEGAGGGRDTVYAYADVDLSLRGANVEAIIARTGGLRLTGNDLDNSISDFASGPGAIMTGGAGSDNFYARNGNSSITEQAGAAGIDRIYAFVDYTIAANVEQIYAAAGGLRIRGNGDANTLFDFADGNPATAGTCMAGGAGDDTFFLRNSLSTITETGEAGSGMDTVIVSFTNYTLGANLENVAANAAGLAINGNGAANRLSDFATGTGTTMAGGLGDDTYYVRNTNSRVSEQAAAGSGVDTVFAYIDFDLSQRGLNVETLRAGSGANTALTGSAFNNTIAGATGNNTLNGGLGLDTLMGGAGADTFVFNTTPSSANVDTITDFSHADDTMSLSLTVFAGLMGTAGNPLSDSQFDALLSSAAYEANDRIIYQTDTGKLFYDADGFGAGTQAAVQIALLTTKPQDIAANDFLLIA